MLVVGYPKSGNTWFCYLLAYCLNAEYDDLDDPGVHPQSDYERQYVKGGLAHKSWQEQTGLILKTHRKTVRPKGEPVVYLVRDGRDVLVSYFHYLQKFFPATFGRAVKGTIWSRLFRFGRPQHEFGGFLRCFAPKWADHVNYWLARNPDVLVRYEDLKKDPTCTLNTIFAGLGVEVAESVILEALDIFSFQKMSGRKEGAEDNKSFYRKGISGDWRNHFSAADLAYFDGKAARVMTELSYKEQ